MKKLLLTTMALTGLAVQSFGQGEVLFNNTATAATKIYVTTNGTSSTDQSAGIAAGALSPANSSLSLMFALYVAPNGTSLPGDPWTNPSWTFANQYATNTQTVGRITAVGPFSATGSGGVVVPSAPIGGTNSLVVIGWDVAHGGSTVQSFITAFNAGTVGLMYGRSGVGSIVMGNGSTPPDTTLFGTTFGQLSGFSMGAAIVPEPATFALAGLGAAAMLIFRRRR